MVHACCSMQVLTWGYVAVEATILEKTLAITSSLAVSCLSGLPSSTARWRNQCLLASYNGNCRRKTNSILLQENRCCRQQSPCHDESKGFWPHAMLAQCLLAWASSKVHMWHRCQQAGAPWYKSCAHE